MTQFFADLTPIQYDIIILMIGISIGSLFSDIIGRLGRLVIILPWLLGRLIVFFIMLCVASLILRVVYQWAVWTGRIKPDEP